MSPSLAIGVDGGSSHTAACVVDGESTGPEPEPIVIPSRLSMSASDSLYLECDSPSPQVDSAYHFLLGGSVSLEDDGSAEVDVTVRDFNEAFSEFGNEPMIFRCRSSQSHSGGSTRRPGTYSATAAGDIAFVWSDVPVPDTAEFRVTSEEVSLGPAVLSRSALPVLPGNAWNATLTLKGATVEVRMVDPSDQPIPLPVNTAWPAR